MPFVCCRFSSWQCGVIGDSETNNRPVPMAYGAVARRAILQEYHMWMFVYILHQRLVIQNDGSVPSWFNIYHVNGTTPSIYTRRENYYCFHWFHWMFGWICFLFRAFFSALQFKLMQVDLCVKDEYCSLECHVKQLSKMKSRRRKYFGLYIRNCRPTHEMLQVRRRRRTTNAFHEWIQFVDQSIWLELTKCDDEMGCNCRACIHENSF